MHCLVNWARRNRGLRPLADRRRLDRSSRLRAAAIRRCRDFSHTPCGQPFMRVFARVGYPRSAAVGENLFWGGGTLSSARSAFQGWLGSPGHRHIVFMRRWRGLGIGVVNAPRLFGAAQVSVWVAQFGTR
ncbi:MAG: CAP domain-containing protein [Actinomycetota bacterium]|nr:CAP domain-containing protein [Actinomycetota bacterium]